MFRLLLGGLEGLEALDELPPERLERRVPVEAREAAHLEDGVAEVPDLVSGSRHAASSRDWGPVRRRRSARRGDGVGGQYAIDASVNTPPQA